MATELSSLTDPGTAHLTPARIGVSRTGTRPLTRTLLELRWDHACALDAVYSELDSDWLAPYGMVMTESRYEAKEIYLKKPDMGRLLTESSENAIARECAYKPQVQIAVSDGLSAKAVEANLPVLLSALEKALEQAGLEVGTPVFVKGGGSAS